MGRKRGVVRLTSKSVCDLLRLPEQYSVADVRMDSFTGGIVELLIDGPDMPWVNDGEQPQVVYLENKLYADGIFGTSIE
jgi:hypothetical protein